MALEKCCFCCRLETGSMILGFLAASLALVSLIFNAISLSYPSHNIYYKDLYPLFGLFTGLAIIDLAAAVMLIFGIANRNHNLLLPWLILRSISLVIIAPITFIIIVVALPIAFPYYLWYCVYSLFHTMRIENDADNNSSIIQSEYFKNFFAGSNNNVNNPPRGADKSILLPAYSQMEQ